MTEAATVSPVVLRNKGAPIRLAKLGDDDALALDDEGEIVFEKVYVRMNCNVMAEIEETWGGGEQLELAINMKPLNVTRQLLSLCLEMEPDEVGRRIDMPKIEEYIDAVQIAYVIASGVDPTKAVEDVTTVRKAVEEQQTKRREEIEGALKKAQGNSESPGANGSESGASSVEVSTSSGV